MTTEKQLMYFKERRLSKLKECLQNRSLNSSTRYLSPNKPFNNNNNSNNNNNGL